MRRSSKRLGQVLEAYDHAVTERAPRPGAATQVVSRPRVAELKAMGKITATGERRRNESGMSASVWRVT